MSEKVAQSQVVIHQAMHQLWRPISKACAANEPKYCTVGLWGTNLKSHMVLMLKQAAPQERSKMCTANEPQLLHSRALRNTFGVIQAASAQAGSPI